VTSYVGHVVEVKYGENKGVLQNHRTLLILVEVNTQDAENMKKKVHHIGHRRIKLSFRED